VLEAVGSLAARSVRCLLSLLIACNSLATIATKEDIKLILSPLRVTIFVVAY
jgi:hypothetical protein